MKSRLLRFDDRLRLRHGVDLLAGADEVGRGCLAGPVVVGAVILPPGLELPGVRDSKKLSPLAREKALPLIREKALAWAVLAVSAEEVDLRNVLAASLHGMSCALGRLKIRPELALIDGQHLPDSSPVPCRAVVQGDGRSLSIAAASILAKVLRDRLMHRWHRSYPVYGFDRHVGYPTTQHMQALQEFGPCPLHRKTFAPVARVLGSGLQTS